MTHRPLDPYLINRINKLNRYNLGCIDLMCRRIGLYSCIGLASAYLAIRSLLSFLYVRMSPSWTSLRFLRKLE